MGCLSVTNPALFQVSIKDKYVLLGKLIIVSFLIMSEFDKSGNCIKFHLSPLQSYLGNEVIEYWEGSETLKW